jgi:glycosyltransferase involved in cell wall biosynthesis
VRDDEERLARCLDCLTTQTFDMSHAEILVVDNDSRRPPVELVRQFPGARLLKQPVVGAYAARNAGLSAAKGEVIAFTDADCLPTPTWLSAGVAAVRADGGIGLVAGQVATTLSQNGRRRPVELYELLHAFPQQRYIEQLHFGATANVFTRRDVIDTVGTFNEALRSGGDKEWGQRVHAAGFALAYAPDAVVRHPARSSWGEYRAKLDRVFAGEVCARGQRGDSWDELGRPSLRSLLPPLRSIAAHWSDPRLHTRSERVLYAVGACVARWSGVAAGARARRRAHEV